MALDKSTNWHKELSFLQLNLLLMVDIYTCLHRRHKHPFKLSGFSKKKNCGSAISEVKLASTPQQFFTNKTLEWKIGLVWNVPSPLISSLPSYESVPCASKQWLVTNYVRNLCLSKSLPSKGVFACLISAHYIEAKRLLPRQTIIPKSLEEGFVASNDKRRQLSV